MATDREAYISGLRKFADILEAHEEVPLPYFGNSPDYARVAIHFLSGDNNKAALAAAARAFPGPLTKGATGGSYFDLRGKLDGFHFELTAYRNEVCERVVTGTETVTTKIPDPSVVVPTVEVTKEIEIVEWRCGSILAP